MKKRAFLFLCLLLAALIAFSACAKSDANKTEPSIGESTTRETAGAIPAYGKDPFVALNGNVPLFTENEYTTTAFENYAPLDALGRCGVTVACVGKELMPTEERGSIGQVKPSGWHTVKYDSVDGKYLYNRCHLIGFQLTGENANTRNLITGTRYLNVEGMLPFENMVADYVKETGNHVLYRVTPVFVDEELVARGVILEALSVEDKGEGICFHVYCYNVQPQVSIDYKTGESREGEATQPVTVLPDRTASLPENGTQDGQETKPAQETYVLNLSSKKIHKSTCRSAETIAEHNKSSFDGDPSTLLAQGYTYCQTCF